VTEGWKAVQGIVAKYDRLKAFGFIVPDDPTLPDFFVCPKFISAERHCRFLIAGQRVEFEPIQDGERNVAHNVRVVPLTIAIQRSGNVVGGKP
jgi:cold shock CspA family protein